MLLVPAMLWQEPSSCYWVDLVSSQAREERNYHIFYELLAGMNDWDKQELYLQGAETYYYLNQVRHTSVTQCFPPLLFVMSLSSSRGDPVS